jgi:hypothetical protein
MILNLLNKSKKCKFTGIIMNKKSDAMVNIYHFDQFIKYFGYKIKICQSFQLFSHVHYISYF